MKLRKTLSLLLALVMLFGVMSTGFTVQAETVPTFAEELEAKYTDPDLVYGSDVRWWLDKAVNTDEVLLQEVQNLYDSGFRGVELCMQSVSRNAPNSVYAYGSRVWAHKWKLLMEAVLDLGMTLSLTSGTNWATTNVNGLDPDSQEASQVIAMGTVKVEPGQTITALPKPKTMRASGVAKFLGAYAYKYTGEITVDKPGRSWSTMQVVSVDFESGVELTKDTTPVQGETAYDQALTWTAPDDGTYVVMAYWTHGNYKSASPSAHPDGAYAVNYFDTRGVGAMKAFWDEYILDDPELNAKIKEGDVQLFMDSIELNPDGGITWWSEAMRDEFIARKGYDPMPYIFLVDQLPQVSAVFSPYIEPARGGWDLEGDKDTRQRFVNDWVDVITQLYCENYLAPMKEWLNSVGIETRAQISYGRSFEITEPSAFVDYPDLEDFNQNCQVDIFRLHVGGGKLQDKTVGSETGAVQPTDTSYIQSRLWEAYSQYAAGVQRINWHIWSTDYGYESEAAWPGAASGFDRWGTRDGIYSDYDEFNAHIGRVQQLMQTGTSRTDVGFIHNNWNQGINFGAGTGNKLTNMNWQWAHQGVYYRSTELQDNGYSYDYIAPDLLKAEGVHFNEETKTVELAGYKALVIYQNWLDADGAALIYEWAQKGLPVVIMEGAAQRTPFNDGRDAELAATLAAMLELPNVKTAEIYSESDDFDYFEPVADGYEDNLMDVLKELGVEPYAGYVEPNHQLLTQTRVDEEGNEYVYVYNYCPNEYHGNSHIEEVQTEDHGLNIETEMAIDGIYVPYAIDAWSGEVTELAGYRYEDGKTIFPIELYYNNVALFALEKAEGGLHVVDTDAAAAFVGENGLAIRATESGVYTAELSDGVVRTFNVEVPAATDLTGWDLTVESWTAGDERIFNTEVLEGLDPEVFEDGKLEVVNSKMSTKKTEIPVKLETLTTWDNIPEVGNRVSGKGYYSTTFNWDASKADGAYIDFGSLIGTMELYVNGTKVGGKISENPTKAPNHLVEGYGTDSRWTGGINWIVPVADIGEYLVDGENTIEIVYSSSLGNVRYNGRDTINKGNWLGVHSKLQPYGPAQAVLVPYVDAEISTIGVNLVGPAEVTLEDALEYTVAVTGAEALATATLSVATEGLDDVTVTAAEGWTVFLQTEEDGVVTVVMGNMDGVNGDAAIATVTGTVDKVGEVSVAIDSITLSAYEGEGETFVNAIIGTGEIVTEVKYSTYDVNQDGTVNQLDITRAQRFFGKADDLADVNDDGTVDITDFVLILNNYSK